MVRSLGRAVPDAPSTPDLRERLAGLVPGAADEMEIHTFHSLGLSILREHPAAAGLHRDFHIAGETERARALAEALELTESKAETLLRAISKALAACSAVPAGTVPITSFV